MHLEEDWLEDNFSCHEPMLYIDLFSEEFETGKDKLGPEEAPIENWKIEVGWFILIIHLWLSIKIMMKVVSDFEVWHLLFPILVISMHKKYYK